MLGPLRTTLLDRPGYKLKCRVGVILLELLELPSAMVAEVAGVSPAVAAAVESTAEVLVGQCCYVECIQLGDVQETSMKPYQCSSSGF